MELALDGLVFWLWACLLLLLPLGWLLAAGAAAVFHELCHAGAVCALGGRVLSVKIGLTGAVMETELHGRGREVLASLAGPAGSFLLVFLAPWAPRIAACGLIQGLFNLLPIYPLDGGRALRRGLEGTLSERRLRILEGGLTALAAFFFLWYSAALALLLLIRGFFAKIPCKGHKNRVQYVYQ